MSNEFNYYAPLKTTILETWVRFPSPAPIFKNTNKTRAKWVSEFSKTKVRIKVRMRMTSSFDLEIKFIDLLWVCNAADLSSVRMAIVF